MSESPPSWTCVIEAKAGVGEVPTWETATGSLYWIDLYGRTLNEFQPSTGERRSWKVDGMPGYFALRPGGGACVVATSKAIVELDLATGVITPLFDAPFDKKQFRFNDGRCDRSGRLWIGTNLLPSSRQPAGSASFWRADERGLAEGIPGVTIANGTAFSPAGDRMYVADSSTDTIWALDYDTSDGSVANRRTFATLMEGDCPDGATVDSEGGYWIALFNAGQIVRFTPDGEVDQVLPSPVPQPTMVCFGGADLQTLYLTTARQFLDRGTLDLYPLAGGIFSCEVDFTGVPEPHVTGI
jgi:L-arabinonolactonase